MAPLGSGAWFALKNDSVTGLPDFGQFADCFDRCRFDPGCAVMVLDVDNFGVAVQVLGPEETNDALKHLAHSLRNRLPPGAALFRQWADQFVVVWPGLSPELCVEAAQDLVGAGAHSLCGYRTAECLAKIEALSKHLPKFKNFLTMSAGVAATQGLRLDAQAALLAAHMNMKQAKAEGRNQVVGGTV